MQPTRRHNLPPSRLLPLTLLAWSLLSAAGCGILTETFPGSDDSATPTNNGNNTTGNNTTGNNTTGNNTPSNNVNNDTNNASNNNPDPNNNVDHTSRCTAACQALSACLPGTAELFSPRSGDAEDACIQACRAYPAPLLEQDAQTPGGAASCEALRAPMTAIACAALCEETLSACPDADATPGRCLEACQALPHTLAPAPGGDTFECRRAAVEQSRPLESADACAALEERRAACVGPSDECMEYCALVQTGCTGDDALFLDEPTCLDACALLPLGDADGDTLTCRLQAAADLTTPDAPAATCLDAGPESPRCAPTEP